MESASLLMFVTCLLLGRRPVQTAAAILGLCWLGHYLHRAWIFPFRMKMQGHRPPDSRGHLFDGHCLYLPERPLALHAVRRLPAGVADRPRASSSELRSSGSTSSSTTEPTARSQSSANRAEPATSSRAAASTHSSPAQATLARSSNGPASPWPPGRYRGCPLPFGAPPTQRHAQSRITTGTAKNSQTSQANGRRSSQA